MKATGAEIEKFYDEWPVGGDFYHEDGFETDNNGKLHLNPSETYDVAEVIGFLCWQGRGEVPDFVEINGTQIHIDQEYSGPDIVDVFKAWRGDARPYSVMLKPEEVERFKTVCAENGWEVL